MPTSLNVIKFHYIGVMEDGGDTVRLVADGEESYIQTYNTVTPLYRKIGNNGRTIYVATFDTRSYMFYMIDCESLMVSHIAKNINISAIKATESGFVVTESRVSNVVMILMVSFLLFGEI